jgi:hypothetical protein
MAARPDLMRGEPIVIENTLGMGRLSHRGRYRSLNGVTLSEGEQFVRFVYSVHVAHEAGAREITTVTTFADSNQNVRINTDEVGSLRTYRCSLPDFFDIADI